MITDQFGITEKEYNAIEEELNYLQSLGFAVKPVIVKMLPGRGISGVNSILVSPNSNLDELRYAVAHEIGHHNMPVDGISFDLWTGEDTGYLVDAYNKYAKQIGTYAETNVIEFWAELFAVVTRPDYNGTIECDNLVIK